MHTLRIVDSHTGGEPTRMIIEGAPDCGSGSMAERAATLRRDFDWLRRAVILEPRGCDWIVGALLQEPCDSTCAAGIIFFNNAGYLGMCGHGLIGVVTTLAHLGRIDAGTHRFETTVGEVSAVLHADGAVSVNNVESYRYRTGVPLNVPGEGLIHGDIAWGGNWFFLVPTESVDPSEIENLTTRTKRIRRELEATGVTGKNGGVIDHIELFGPPSDSSGADSRNFVLCPGGEYDRSPCGTGTSAKLACLAADGHLKAGEEWRQESIIGSVFKATYQPAVQGVAPTITGRAYVTAESQLLLGENDPYRHGITLGSETAR
jgi:4-hydroxyproline epimerase